MERYLVYDSACAVCNHIAQEIENLASDKVKAIGIHDGAARSLLDEAYPAGWQHAPYLVTVQGGRVRASTGLGAVMRLGLFLGPRRGRKAWALARRSGISVAALAVPSGGSLARRYVLKLFGTLAAVGGLLLTRRAVPASADWCPECTCANYYWIYLGCGVDPDCGCPSCGVTSGSQIYVQQCIRECYYDWCSCWSWEECMLGQVVALCCQCQRYPC